MEKKTEPTNWASFFGGSCWNYDSKTNEYYMKIFSDKMPDLNWENPKVIDEYVKIISYWCDLGIDGFRIDAVSHLAKSEFIDSSLFPDEIYKPEWQKYSNLYKLHTYLKELNIKAFSKYNIVTIGEVGGRALVEDALNYVDIDRKELDMVFNFDHNWCNNGWGANDQTELKTNVMELKDVFNKWQNGLYGQGWNAIYWLNHDQPRVVSHYGDISNYHKESAKMLATAMYFMWGTPFIYNGEEIGMTNPKFEKIEDFRDISTITQYYINVNNHQDPKICLKNASMSSRDNARSLMQWNKSVNGGFTFGEPWNIIGDYQKINVEDQIDDLDSIYNYYQRVIKLRTSSLYKDVIVYGTYQQVYYNHQDVYGYIREDENFRILILCNFTKEKIILEDFNYNIKNIIISNYNRSEFNIDMLPFEAIVLEIKKKENTNER